MRPRAQCRVEPAQVVQLGHQFEAGAGHVEVVAVGRAALELTVEHVLAAPRVRTTVEVLLRAVIKARNAARRVKERQRHLEARGVSADAGAEEPRVVVVVEVEHQRIERRRVVVQCAQVAVATLDLAGAARGRSEHAADLVIHRIVEHAIHLVVAAGFCARVGTALAVGSVENLAEHEKVRLVGRRRGGSDHRRPFIPESHLDVFDRVDAIGIEPRGVDPVTPDLLHLGPHVGRFGAEIVQRCQLAQFDLRGIRPVRRAAVVVENIREARVAENLRQVRVGERRGILLPARVVAQVVAGRRVFERGPTRIATVHPCAAVVHDNIIDHENSALVRLGNQALQIGQRAHARIHRIEIRRRVSVVITVGVFDHRRDPDRRRAEGLDVVELLLDALEITAVGLAAIGLIVIRQQTVVRRVRVEKPVGDDLVNTLVAPEIRRVFRRVARIEREDDFVEGESRIPHPDVERVRAGGRHGDRHRHGRAGSLVRPRPRTRLGQVDLCGGRTCTIETHINGNRFRRLRIAPDPDVIGARVGEVDSVLEFRRSRGPTRSHGHRVVRQDLHQTRAAEAADCRRCGPCVCVRDAVDRIGNCPGDVRRRRRHLRFDPHRAVGFRGLRRQRSGNK